MQLMRVLIFHLYAACMITICHNYQKAVQPQQPTPRKRNTNLTVRDAFGSETRGSHFFLNLFTLSSSMSHLCCSLPFHCSLSFLLCCSPPVACRPPERSHRTSPDKVTNPSHFAAQSQCASPHFPTPTPLNCVSV